MPELAAPACVSFRVIGIAQPKGSTRAFTPKGWTRPIITSDNPKVKGWQQLVAEQAQGVAAKLFTGAVALTVTFYLLRPKSLAKRVQEHTKKPDLDKLVRSTKDALKGVLYQDDSQVVYIAARKVYAAPGMPACADIRLDDMTVREIEGEGLFA